MQILSYFKKKPSFDKTNFLATGSVLIGEVLLEENVNIWFNCVVRADVNAIKIKKNTNIQDLSMLHVTEKYPLIISANSTIGHSVILHGCEVGENCLIGMGAKILDGAHIKKGSVVAAGSIVPPGKTYPENSMIMGTPAKAVRKLSADEVLQYSNHYKMYLEYAKKYLSKDVKDLSQA